MKTFKQFEITNNEHLAHLQKAVAIAQNQTLESGQKYLAQRFGIAPFKALEALFVHNLGYEITQIQQCYVDAYTRAVRGIQPPTFIQDDDLNQEQEHSNYPDDFNPDLYDF